MRRSRQGSHSLHDDEIQPGTHTVASPLLRPRPSVHCYRCNAVQSRTSRTGRDGIVHRLRMFTGTKHEEEEHGDEPDSLLLSVLTP